MFLVFPPLPHITVTFLENYVSADEARSLQYTGQYSSIFVLCESEECSTTIFRFVDSSSLWYKASCEFHRYGGWMAIYLYSTTAPACPYLSFFSLFFVFLFSPPPSHHIHLENYVSADGVLSFLHAALRFLIIMLTHSLLLLRCWHRLINVCWCNDPRVVDVRLIFWSQLVLPFVSCCVSLIISHWHLFFALCLKLSSMASLCGADSTVPTLSLSWILSGLYLWAIWIMSKFRLLFSTGGAFLVCWGSLFLTIW